ncbi:unnamed protein product [Ophioblennius macclurei]
MASRWTVLCVAVFLLTDVSADPSPRYVLRQTASDFAEAARRCSPGVLTTLSTQQEVTEVLAAVAASASPPGEFVLWVGLKKERKECVVPSLPLRGFRWVQDGGQESQVSQWAEEPQQTCTTIRCAALKGNLHGSAVTTWGLVPVSCKNPYGFICKLQDGMTAVPSETPMKAPTQAPEPEPETTEPELVPQTEQPITSEPEPKRLRPSTSAPAVSAPATSQSEQEQTKLFELLPGPDPALELEPKPSSEPVPGSDPCHNPVIPGSRFLSRDPENSSQVRVECWSSIQLDLTCSGQPTMWRMLDGVPANFSGLCQKCETGFRKNATGHCEDVDECRTGTPCKHKCLNTEGSFRCVCGDDDHPDDGTAPCGDEVTVENAEALSGILIPVLIAVAALVVLVVVVAVAVKCCLMRRSKKHAIKKAEKMGGLDSFETANDKATTT